MVSSTPDAHILVTIPSATLTSSSSETFANQQLALEYVTFDIPESSTAATRDVLLVLRVGTTGTGTGNGSNAAFEAPLDPARGLTVSTLPAAAATGATAPMATATRRYVFHATRDDAEFSVELPVTPETADDLELFHSVLVGYATDLHSDAPADADADAQLQQQQQSANPEEEDLRGRFVLVNEDNGEIVGALDGSVRVYEDPSLGEKGHEEDPVVVELPEGASALDELRDIEVLVRTVPPEDRDWMLKGAVFVSHAISGTTTLLTSVMATASNYYIAHSTPASSASSTSASRSSASPGPSRHPTPPPSRTLLLLQSPTTRKNLARIHTVSGSAVKLSNKAHAAIERMIQRATRSAGRDKGKGPALPIIPTPHSHSDTGKPPLPPRSRDPSPVASPLLDNKPPLPPRDGKSPSPAPTPLMPPASQPYPRAAPSSSTSTPPLRTHTRVAISAAIVLASMAASSVRLVEAGGAAVTAAVSHKYGAAAGENAALAARTMRNVVLVYVDMRGLGRRAIVRHAAKTWANGRTARAR